MNEMDLKTAQKILEMIEKTTLTGLIDDLLKTAVRYARIRTDWRFLTLDDKKEKDQTRTLAHNAFIDCCNILSRNMQKNGENHSWRKILGEDRKNIGDFACYLHCVLGIQSR